MKSHLEHLNNKLQDLDLDLKETNYNLEDKSKELEKSKLNFDILIRVKKKQDEISEFNGPQSHVDDLILIDSYIIEDLNKRINNFYQTKVSI